MKGPEKTASSACYTSTNYDKIKTRIHIDLSGPQPFDQVKVVIIGQDPYHGRGIWYVLDAIDYWLFGGYHLWTGLLGIIVGVLVLYLPDRDLKEIEKL